MEQPGARAQELVELDHLAVADKHPVFAGEGLEQAVELAQQILGEVAVAVAQGGPVGLELAPRHLHGQVAVGLEQVRQGRVTLTPGLEVEVALGLGVEAGVDELEEVLVLHGVGDDLEAEAILERAELGVFGDLVGRREQDLERDGDRGAVLVVLALVDDRQQRVEDRRVRLEDLIEEHHPRRRQLALGAAHVATLAQEVDVDRAHDLRGLGEAREHVLEVVVVRDAERVAELDDEVRLGCAGHADEQQRLLGDGADRHEIDDLLARDEVVAQREAKAVAALAQGVRLVRERLVVEGRNGSDLGVELGDLLVLVWRRGAHARPGS